METETQNQELLEFFKTLANADRLRIVGLLSIEPLAAPELARRLGLQPMAALRHLERLQSLGIVRQAGAGAPDETIGGAPLSLDTAALEAMSKRMLAGSRPRFAAGEQSGDEFDRKVLRDYMTADGALKSIPSQEKKLIVVLRHLAQAFEPDRRYAEKDVNAILKRYHPDTPALRRSLVDHGLLARSQGEYWKV
jgi:DNA-binding transcriptional ArsR family regulator